MDRTCLLEGCDKPPRGCGASLCPMHYHRQYRHGSTDATFKRTVTGAGRRYRSYYKPGHPIAGKSGKVYAHRFALYEHIGPGPHHCAWCGTTVHWHPLPDEDLLYVDHLDGIGDHNQPANLVPACRACNSIRSALSHSTALRALGAFANHDTVALTQGGRKVDSVDLPTNADFAA